MFTKKFFVDLLERTLASFAQAYVAAQAVLPGDLLDIVALKVAIGASILAILKGVAATKTGDNESASLTD